MPPLEMLKQALLRVMLAGFAISTIGTVITVLSSTPSEGLTKVSGTGFALGLFSFTAYASTRARTRQSLAVLGTAGTGISIIAMLLVTALIWVLGESENPLTIAKITGIASVVALCIAHTINLVFLKPGHRLTEAFKIITIAFTIILGGTLIYVIFDPGSLGFFYGTNQDIMKVLAISGSMVFFGTISSMVLSKYLK